MPWLCYALGCELFLQAFDRNFIPDSIILGTIKKYSGGETGNNYLNWIIPLHSNKFTLTILVLTQQLQKTWKMLLKDWWLQHLANIV